jgi:putative two-component system response regulator
MNNLSIVLTGYEQQLRTLSEQMPRLLVVDDEPNNLRVMRQILQDKYELAFAKDGVRAIALALEQKPHLILMDVMMPEMDGFEACRRIKQIDELAHIPLIFVTAMTDIEDETQGFRLGAVDYIAKPISAAIVRARVENHLSLVRAAEVEMTRLEIIRRLGRAAEYRDNETGLHVIRMSHYSRLLGEEVGLNGRASDLLLNAAPMHDIGKIGIPDRILLKPSALDPDEWKTMREHPQIGAKIIGGDTSELLQLAQTIALTHHEKWDGSGYPKGLAGEEIPLVGRIIAIADVFDALTTRRPYKNAWPHEQAIDYLQAQSGAHFDPQLVPLFLDRMDDVLRVKNQWADQ